MNEKFDIQRYMTNGVENIVRSAVKATLSNPAESIFMAKFAVASKNASKRRMEFEKSGEHIPAFLIASITSSCNLHCAGCYSRANDACVAAGRGFFHINSQGGAEPCPFSPYSDVNVRDTSLREALHSKLFIKLQENGMLIEEHAGGCVLFERKEEVEKYLGSFNKPFER